MRAFYEQQITALNMKNVRIGTMWLRAEDYPRLLGTFAFSYLACIFFIYCKESTKRNVFVSLLYFFSLRLTVLTLYT